MINHHTKNGDFMLIRLGYVSISKTLEQSFNIKFKKGIFIVLAVALPISQIGFSNLISTLYPLFGLLSLIFITQCIYFYYKHKSELN